MTLNQKYIINSNRNIIWNNRIIIPFKIDSGPKWGGVVHFKFIDDNTIEWHYANVLDRSTTLLRLIKCPEYLKQ